MDLVQGYLRLNSAYCNELGGLRWSSSDDAIEFKDGSTFAFHVQIVLLLRGFGNSRRLIHFCLLLHLLEMLRGHRLGGHTASAAPPLLVSDVLDKQTGFLEARVQFARLRRAFDAAGRKLFNAGAFYAVLCRTVPPVPEPIAVAEVQKRLEQSSTTIRWSLALYHDALTPSPRPPLTPAEFEALIARQVRAYTDEELETWFRTGRGPVKEAAEALVPALIPPAPITLTGVLTALLDRPRLYGARPYIAQMVSALTLPARQQVHAEIPIGGYDEVTTRGQPDQILLSQFALDEWDFFRRYAEKELLYFRREEPHARCRQELVVLLDQGVRTWGDVRLVLTAALVALGRQAQRRGWPFLVAATSAGGRLVDPLTADPDALARLLGASDLSPNPGLALETVLEDAPEEAQDVVVLTHPRNLREEDVRTAACRLTAGQRLFALAVDGAGQAELSEVKHGVPVTLRELHVDFAAAAPPDTLAQQAAEPLAPWEGDIEPVGFPFWLGVNQPLGPKLFAFDRAGEWMLAVTTTGYLYAWKLDGTRREMLPRGYRDGVLLKQVEAVLGVAGGFVVAGRAGKELLAMHYDFVARKGTLHTVGMARDSQWHWGYDREHHAILAFGDHALGYHGKYTLDLQTGVCFSSQVVDPVPKEQAWPEAELAATAGGWLRVFALPLDAPYKGSFSRPFISVDSNSGGIISWGTGSTQVKFVPVVDGLPVLKGCEALEAQRYGQTLAVRTTSAGRKKPFLLHVFQGPEWRLSRSYRAANSDGSFLLSPDGRYLCRLVNPKRLKVYDIAGEVRVLLTQRDSHSYLRYFMVGKDALVLCTGPKKDQHVLRWKGSRLEITLFGKVIGELKSSLLPWVSGLSMSIASREAASFCLDYDEDRFTQGTVLTDRVAVADRFGQVALLDRSRKLICMVVAFRDELAIWLPDGTCYGPAALTGRPATPNALEKIARALKRASQEGERT